MDFTTSVDYSSLKDEGVIQGDHNWMDKYKSVFTYANYNDVDRMGYEAPKRYPIPVGPRYKTYTYRNESRNEREKAKEPSVSMIAVEMLFLCFSYFMLILTLPISLVFSLKFIGEFERLVVLRLGRAQKLRGPGATLILPCIDNYAKVDLRVTAFNVPPMQIITIDRGLVELGATVFLQVKDAIAAVCAVKERNHSTRSLAVTVLHRITCKRQLNDITSSSGRKELAERLQNELSELTVSWGVEVLRVELSDVKVLKEGENMALSVFNKIMKSEIGNEMIGTLARTAHEFVCEQEKEKRFEQKEEKLGTQPSGEDLIKFPEALNEENMFRHIDLDELVNNILLVLDESLVSIVCCIYQINCNGLDLITLVNILKQKVTPLQAYMCGSLKIKGSLKTASKFTTVIDRFKGLI